MSPSKTLTSLKSPFASPPASKEAKALGRAAGEPSTGAEAGESKREVEAPGAARSLASMTADQQQEGPAHVQGEPAHVAGQRGEEEGGAGAEARGGSTHEKKRGRVQGLTLLIPPAPREAAASEGKGARHRDFLASISLGVPGQDEQQLPAAAARGSTNWAVAAGVARVASGAHANGLLPAPSPARSLGNCKSYSAASSPTLLPAPRLSSSGSLADDSLFLTDAVAAHAAAAPNSARSSLNEKIGHKFEGIMGTLGIKSGDRKLYQRPAGGPGSRKGALWKHAELQWEQRQMTAYALVAVTSNSQVKKGKSALSPPVRARAHTIPSGGGLPGSLERQRSTSTSMSLTPCASVGDASDLLLAPLDLATEGEDGARGSARSSISSDDMAPEVAKLTTGLGLGTSPHARTSPQLLSSSPQYGTGEGGARGAGGSVLSPPIRRADSSHDARSRAQEREDGKRKRREARELREQRRREHREAHLGTSASSGCGGGGEASASISRAASHKPSEMMCEVPVALQCKCEATLRRSRRRHCLLGARCET